MGLGLYHGVNGLHHGVPGLVCNVFTPSENHFPEVINALLPMLVVIGLHMAEEGIKAAEITVCEGLQGKLHYFFDEDFLD